MSWNVKFLPEAQDDLFSLDKSQQKLVVKAIQKVKQNPLSSREGGYGKPLGNKRANKLSGFLKIKLRSAGIRVVYQPIKTESEMLIIIIGVREDNEVYEVAGKRIKKHKL
ncbi:type II toxin-antitoxin system RelE family toxin [Dubosiella newyorkensis]|uniref:Addiction module toxin RelE n=1 Tax=Dubosiella newyorkensis TaxID=1862672 RepID=A0A1U7NLS4_9FIRM|nr:type II toxin-antitoxin system RelE/ParE family toxin [Dubosiella newyorkensis]OLU45817.1 addiction module toxin RelE [Dubosiella newyorkensis]